MKITAVVLVLIQVCSAASSRRALPADDHESLRHSARALLQISDPIFLLQSAIVRSTGVRGLTKQALQSGDGSLKVALATVFAQAAGAKQKALVDAASTAAALNAQAGLLARSIAASGGNTASIFPIEQGLKEQNKDKLRVGIQLANTVGKDAPGDLAIGSASAQASKVLDPALSNAVKAAFGEISKGASDRAEADKLIATAIHQILQAFLSTIGSGSRSVRSMLNIASGTADATATIIEREFADQAKTRDPVFFASRPVIFPAVKAALLVSVRNIIITGAPVQRSAVPQAEVSKNLRLTLTSALRTAVPPSPNTARVG